MSSSSSSSSQDPLFSLGQWICSVSNGARVRLERKEAEAKAKRQKPNYMADNLREKEEQQIALMLSSMFKAAIKGHDHALLAWDGPPHYWYNDSLGHGIRQWAKHQGLTLIWQTRTQLRAANVRYPERMEFDKCWPTLCWNDWLPEAGTYFLTPEEAMAAHSKRPRGPGSAPYEEQTEGNSSDSDGDWEGMCSFE